MQVSGKSLLNSAESILRDRKQDRGPGPATGPELRASGRELGLESLQQGVLESRLLSLQANLSAIQRDYSREQSRHSYLTQNPSEINAELRFGEEALFPEFRAGMDLGQMRGQVGEAMERLVRALKSVQVEMENLHALSFEAPVTVQAGEAQQLVDRGGLKELDPERVARLTRP